MNRREAIAALTAIPGLASIERAELKPRDVLVFSVDSYISQDQAERIKAMAQQVWPEHKVVVIDKGLSLKVVREQDAKGVAGGR